MILFIGLELERSVKILKLITANAKIPNGCERKEEVGSPCRIIEMEFPKPHPGQLSIPTSLKAQNV